ncbi:MAG: sulfotransferase [Salinibacter sp.]
MSAVNEVFNRAWYLWRRNRWMLNPRSYISSFPEVPIQRPVFLLGVQGGGLTLVSRMLRRHPRIVSVSGNHRYWAGADEIHTVFGPLLPPELTGTRYKVPWPDHPLFDPPRSWAYASDELLPYYRKTSQDATPELRERLQRVIRMSVAQHAEDPDQAQFIDKSQVYTVRISLVRELLRENYPKFVLVPVNPFASCYRAALGKAQDMYRLRHRLSFLERLDICAQHWKNSMQCALEDRDDDLMIVKFEDILTDPSRSIGRICEHVEIDYRDDLLPAPNDRVPFGSRFRDRWYPLDPDRALKYKEQASDEELDVIHAQCAEIAAELGYEDHKG